MKISDAVLMVSSQQTRFSRCFHSKQYPRLKLLMHLMTNFVVHTTSSSCFGHVDACENSYRKSNNACMTMVDMMRLYILAKLDVRSVFDASNRLCGLIAVACCCHCLWCWLRACSCMHRYPSHGPHPGSMVDAALPGLAACLHGSCCIVQGTCTDNLY